MAAGVVDEWSAVRMDVFECDPRGAQIAERISGHVNGIRMQTLLGSLVGCDRLQGPRFMIHQKANRSEQAGMFQKAAESA